MRNSDDLYESDTVHPLRNGKSEVYINLNPSICKGKNEKDNCVVYKELYNLVKKKFLSICLASAAKATYLSKTHAGVVTTSPFIKAGASYIAGYIVDPDPVRPHT